MPRHSALLIAVLVACAASYAQEKRYHGQTLDENRQLLIEETDGVLRIGVFERTRSAGDYLHQQAPSGPGISPRANPAPDYMIEVRSEVLKSSAPNYLQNPGERYRITINTLEMSTEYENMVEVPAEFARDQLFYEFQQIRERTIGIERQVVEAAAPLVAEIFKEARLLPAEIFTSVLKSRGGQFRITPSTRQRRKIEPSQTFAPKLEINRPELGATMRAREKKVLPPGATKPGDVSGPQIDAQIKRPSEPGQFEHGGPQPQR
ncbi:MAG: hypothetical protein SGI88_17925 [Candidatus Hydrogenedentes bacterium]|nr:hypothetical protein [Candidatus Hydrogenedentota bacterium]